MLVVDFGPVPERLDWIIVTTSAGSVSLPWASREALLDEMRHSTPRAGIVKAFTGGSDEAARFKDR